MSTQWLPGVVKLALLMRMPPVVLPWSNTIKPSAISTAPLAVMLFTLMSLVAVKISLVKPESAVGGLGLEVV